MSEEKRLMMSEEEVRQRTKELLTLPKEDLITQHLFIEQENQKYKEVIDKAIEYTEEHRIKNPYHYEYNCFMGNARASDLLEILKGE